MSYCKCGVEIHPQRVKFLEKYNKPMCCMDCSTTQKVGGFMATSGKTDRQIIIADMETISNLNNLSARAGMGVSRGCKMSQNFSAKLFK